PLAKVDPVYFEKSYYLGPDKGGEKAYRLLSDAMTQAGKVALAKFVLRGRENLVLVRSAQNGLMLHTMYFADEVRNFDEISKGESAKISGAETNLALRLIDELSNEEFHPEQYEDEYRQRVLNLVNTKAEGKEITIAEPQVHRAQVIDLMEALKESLGKTVAKEKKPAVRAKTAEPEKGSVRQEMNLFTTGEVAKILNLPGSRIRSFVRAGFLAPARGEKKTFQFTFQDLLFLKTAKGLLDSRVPSKRIIRMLSSLKR